jgi:hypothetical protein
MNDSKQGTNVSEVDYAISLAEAALMQCDKAGLIWPAIDLSSALDKLRAHREGLVNH